jgi:U4/U6 small nuclear ribonucleoprotein PRP4
MISSDELPTTSTLTLSSSNAETIAQHEKLMRAHELQKKARNLPVPTNDKEVKLRLRELGHPICLFGEDAGYRRERLRAKITEYYIEKGEAPAFCQRIIQSQMSSSASTDANEVFYIVGTDSLREARLLIAKYSLPRAQ